MNKITIRPVRTRQERHIFLTFPWRIYRPAHSRRRHKTRQHIPGLPTQPDPIWVPPLLPDLAERIDRQKGSFFQHGDAEFYIAWHGDQPVGTICAAEDRQMNQERQARECIFGFLNLIEDYGVMDALLAQVCTWAHAHGLDTLTGPFNLDYEDGYGILVEGRDRPPVLMCGHTPPYYLGFMERYGFEPARGDNIAFAFDIRRETPATQHLHRLAERLRQRKNFTVRAGDLAHWQDEVEKIYVLLNTCMTHLPDYRPWPREVVFNSLAPFRKVADAELILFAEDGERTVGWLPGLPNLNEAFIHADGLRHPWNYLPLGWHLGRILLRRNSLHPMTKCLTMKSVLVLPEYWGSGVGILLFDEMKQRAQARGYQWIDGSLTSADNPNTPPLGERFGAQIYKRYRVYRKKI